MRNRILLVLTLVLAVLSSSSSAADASRFTLAGIMVPDLDPENPGNEVISIDPPQPPPYVGGAVTFPLPPGTRAEDLDNQLSLKHYFVVSPDCHATVDICKFSWYSQILLSIDSDGDGVHDFNAFGGLGNFPCFFLRFCALDTWVFTDLTDAEPRWDFSAAGGGSPATWDQMETFLAANYPDYQILNGSLVDEGTMGKKYFDLVTIGNGTLDGHEDLASSGPSATFVGVDHTTKGNWIGAYGADGYVIANDSQFNPGYVNAVTLAGQLNFTWTPSASDPRALFRGAPNSAQRRAGTWYRANPFTIDIDFADDVPHRVALYIVDWDSFTRAQQIQVIDPATSMVLDTQNVSGFNGGRYLIWDVAGDVRFVVTKTGGVNGVVSAVFFNP